MATKEISERIVAFGHRNILATHPSTLMITKEAEVSLAGDCIIAIAADKAGPDLNSQFKELLAQPVAKLTIKVEAAGLIDKINACGSPKLMLTHPTDLVVRKSNYICSRTLATGADKAAINLTRELAEKLKNPKQQVNLTLTVQA